MSNATILIADDEPRLRRLVRDFLEADGYKVLEAADGEEALKLFRAEKEAPDLVVLDVMMPKLNGWDVCREIRRSSSVPVIMLTALSRESDEIAGFDVGADEYITKPFSPRIFVARVEALLRRSGKGKGAPPIEAGGVRIDTSAHTVYIDGREVYLSLKEYDLLVYLAVNRGKTLSRENILDTVWNYDFFGDARTIDTHMTKLRKKLDPYGDLLHTVRRVGYKFEK